MRTECNYELCYTSEFSSSDIAKEAWHLLRKNDGRVHNIKPCHVITFVSWLWTFVYKEGASMHVLLVFVLTLLLPYYRNEC